MKKMVGKLLMMKFVNIETYIHIRIFKKKIQTSGDIP